MGIFQSQLLGSLIHLLHKTLNGGGGVDALVVRYDPAHIGSQGIGGVVTAFQKHTCHHLPGGEGIAGLQTRGGGIRIDVGQGRTGDHFLVGINVLQSHIRGKQLGDTGRIDGFFAVAGKQKEGLGSAVIDKILLGAQLFALQKGDPAFVQFHHDGRFCRCFRGRFGRRLRGLFRGFLEKTRRCLRGLSLLRQLLGRLCKGIPGRELFDGKKAHGDQQQRQYNDLNNNEFFHRKSSFM